VNLYFPIWQDNIFILLSIKTRIETVRDLSVDEVREQFLSYYPLKQGLKQSDKKRDNSLHKNFYPTIH